MESYSLFMTPLVIDLDILRQNKEDLANKLPFTAQIIESRSNLSFLEEGYNQTLELSMHHVMARLLGEDEMDAILNIFNLFKLTESFGVSMNPNYLNFYAGTFESESHFNQKFGKEYRKRIQNKLYHGGNCSYLGSTGEYSMQFGDEAILKNYGGVKITDMQNGEFMRC